MDWFLYDNVLRQERIKSYGMELLVLVFFKKEVRKGYSKMESSRK